MRLEFGYHALQAWLHSFAATAAKGVARATKTVISQSEQQTYNFARELAAGLKVPAHILLHGDLGAGKTVFAKGLADGFGVADIDEVSSPTFTLINHYAGRVRIYHIDLYRIETGAFDGLGLEEIFDDANAAVIIEWAERLGSFATPGAVRVFLSYVDDHSRKIDVC
jgi:tRNA threonylcarbamoyladenosine biosynthesis protein TsaE